MLAHALIVSPLPSSSSWAIQSVYMAEIVGPARRVSLPTPKRDLLTPLAETIRACASTVGSGKGVGSEVDPTRG